MIRQQRWKGAALLVFPLVFNALFFLLKPDLSKGAVWVNYAVIHAAYLFLVLGPKGNDRQLPLLGLSLRLVCFWYFVYALAVGVLLIAAAPDLLWLTLVLQFVPAGVIVLLLVMMIGANERTQAYDSQARRQSLFIRVNVELLSRAIGQSHSETAKRALDGLHTALQASPSKSHESVASLEENITKGIVTLVSDSGSNDESFINLTKQIMNMLSERNSRLRLLN